MAALEAVVGERNAAVTKLETGAESTRPTAYVTSELGLKFTSFLLPFVLSSPAPTSDCWVCRKELDEHPVPHWQNPRVTKQYERPQRSEMERSFEAHLWSPLAFPRLGRVWSVFLFAGRRRGKSSGTSGTTAAA